MNFATVHGLRTGDNPAGWDLIQHAVPPQPNGRKARHAALDWREVPAFMARLREVESVAARCAEFIVLTAARSGEARGARWGEVKSAVWTLALGCDHAPLSLSTDVRREAARVQ
jgi:integrase